MEVLINTKYNIGDTCYICKSSLSFKEGKFCVVYEACETPGRIVSITSYINSDKDISFSYTLNNMSESISEKLVFPTYEECQKYCNSINE